MGQTFYPTALQLTQRLYAAGVVSIPLTSTQDMLELESACEAAAQSWENMTKFTPFLADAAETTEVFDGDGSQTLDLHGGYVSISNVSLNGTTRALNTDYRLMPRNAFARNKPVTYLMWQGGFYRPFPAWYGQAAPVMVTGRRGAYAELPALAYEGILGIAILSLLGQTQFSRFGGIASWKVGTDEETYNLNAYNQLLASIQYPVRQALNNFTRWTIG